MSDHLYKMVEKVHRHPWWNEERCVMRAYGKYMCTMTCQNSRIID